MHLEAFLRNTNEGEPATAKFRAHANSTLNRLKGVSTDGAASGIPNDVAGTPAEDGAEDGAS
jgi:hypothetical protein